MTNTKETTGWEKELAYLITKGASFEEYKQFISKEIQSAKSEAVENVIRVLSKLK